MEEKYDVAPCFGQVVDDSTTSSPHARVPRYVANPRIFVQHEEMRLKLSLRVEGLSASEVIEARRQPPSSAFLRFSVLNVREL